MATYNGISVPSSIRTCRIVSAFANEIDFDKVQLYTEEMKNKMLSHEFPPISGFPFIITDDDFGLEFLSGEEVTEDMVGQMAWKVTDGHHRTLAAIAAEVPIMETELDFSTITNEVDVKNFSK